MSFLKSATYWFLALCVLFIPFPFYVFSFQKEITTTIFQKPSSWIITNIFDWEIINPEITSDSATMYGLVFLFFLLAIAIALLTSFFSFFEKHQTKVFQILRLLFIYYLSLQLLKYGFAKIFKSQFYLPEPNILYTDFGKISKDLLFWSTIGTSLSYNIFMGMLEVIPAIFLLFKKTRIVGLLIAIPVLIHVVAINLSFDISVKIYSVFLLLLSCFLFSPYLKTFYQFFILKEKTDLPTALDLFSKNTFLRVSLKSFLVGLIFLEALFPSFSSGNFNDDKLARPLLHGAYEVVEVIARDSLTTAPLSIKRFFIHRNGYLIFQNKNEEMQDFKLEIKQNQLELIDYQNNTTRLSFEYNDVNELLELQFFQNKKEYLLKGKALDWENLPALQNDFHWNVDEVD